MNLDEMVPAATLPPSGSALRQLAQFVALAARIEPELLRSVRLALLPQTEPGLEADFWFGPWVQSHSTQGAILLVEVADQLRAELAAAPPNDGASPLQAAWKVIQRVHQGAPQTTKIEEQLTKMALVADPVENTQVEEQLRGLVVEMLHNEERRLGLARWAARALPRMPAALQKSSAGTLLAFCTSATLGGPQGLGADSLGAVPMDHYAWVVSAETTKLAVGVRLLENGVEFGDPTLEGAHPITVPDTSPLFVEVSWPSAETLSGHSAALSSVAWSPDGKLILTASHDGTAGIWEHYNGQQLALLRGHVGWVNSAVWSPDGQYIVTAGSDGTARLWDTNGTQLRVFDPATQAGNPPPAPDDAGADGPNSDRVTAVDPASRHATMRVWCVAIAPDGKSLLEAGIASTIRRWDLASGRLLHTFSGHSAEVTALAWSPDGRRFVSAADDSTARLWDASSGQMLWVLNAPANVVNWVTSGDLIGPGPTGPHPLAALRRPVGGFINVLWSADGGQIVTCTVDGTVQRWDLRSRESSSFSLRPQGEPRRDVVDYSEAAESTPAVEPTVVHAAVWSPDRRWIACGDSDGIVMLNDANNASLRLSFRAHAAPIYQLAWSPDGSLLATASADGTACVWDAATGTTHQIIMARPVTWSPGLATTTITAPGPVTIRTSAGASYVLRPQPAGASTPATATPPDAAATTDVAEQRVDSTPHVSSAELQQMSDIRNKAQVEVKSLNSDLAAWEITANNAVIAGQLSAAQIQLLSTMLHARQAQIDAHFTALDRVSSVNEMTKIDKELRKAIVDARQVLQPFADVVAQLNDPSNSEVAQAANSIVQQSYEEFINRAVAWGVVSADQQFAPPLVNFQNNTLFQSASVLLRGSTVDLPGPQQFPQPGPPKPLSIIILPTSNSRLLWNMCQIYHELGHVLSQDLSLDNSIGKQLQQLSQSASASQAADWLRWLAELICDSFAVLLGGVGYVNFLSSQLLNAPNATTLERAGQFAPGYVRVFFTTQLLRLLQQPAPAAAIEQQWIAAYKTPVELAPYLANVETVADLLLHTPYSALKNHSLADFVPFFADDQEFSDHLATYLDSGQPAPDDRPDAMRLLPAAAQLSNQRKAISDKQGLDAIQRRGLDWLKAQSASPQA